MEKIAIITGCSRGIGKEIALELARDGYDIIGTYNSRLEDILLLKKKIELIGVNFNYYKLDLSDENDVIAMCNDIMNKYNKIDLLVNNASISLDNDFYSKTKDEFLKVLEVNLIGPFLLINKLYNLLENGIVINISSTDGINTYSNLNIDYSASKAGLINLTKSLALALPNLKIYSICPNWVNTEAIQEMNQEYLREELKRIGQHNLIEPKRIANKVIGILEEKPKSGLIIVLED